MEPLLASVGGVEPATHYRKGAVIYTQGDAATDVRYLQRGLIRLCVLSHSGKEAVVAMLAEGDFFGEGTMAGQTVRMSSAVAATACSVVTVSKDAMGRLLHEEPAFAARFLSHMLARNIRIEADLVDQLFNSSEKRLARTLLLLARYGETHPTNTVPKVSQETLAEMIGTTRSRVNFFMNKFRKLGFIEYNGRLKIHPALLSVVLHD